jgi:SAM-dependent methyltransferase
MLRKVDWHHYENPAKTYSPWKRTLKGIVVRGLYRKLVEYAVFSSNEGRKLILKTDLWVEALGLSEFKGIRGNYDLVGVELSKGICEGSKAVMSGRSIVCASIRYLPFRSGAFTTLVDISTLDHVSYEEARYVVAEYSRVLKEGGVLLLCIDSILSFPWEMYRKLVLKFTAWSWLPRYVRQMVSNHDFEIINRFYANTLLDSFSDIFWQMSGWSDTSRWTFRQEWNKVYAFIAQYYAVVARKDGQTTSEIDSAIISTHQSA